MIIIKKNKENNIKIIIISIATSSLFSCISSYATSRHLYDSKEVRYDNTSTNVLTSATDIQTAIDDLYSCASTYELTVGNSAFHNSIFRGKDVTEYLTSEYSLYDRISDGTFTDLYVGDYVVANGITWRIAGFDLYYGKGQAKEQGDDSTNQAGNRHHAVIVPDTNLTRAQMNTTSTTKGGYVGSAMYTTTLPTVLSTYITPVFGDHVLTYFAILTIRINSTTGKADDADYIYSRKVDLMNEVQLFGTTSYSSSEYETGIDNIQFPLFRLKPEYINKFGGWYSLRNVIRSCCFAEVMSHGGIMSSNSASNKTGVRPYFYIG